MYDDRCQLDLFWWSFHHVYKYQIIICTPETNIMLYINYNSIKKKKVNIWYRNIFVSVFNLSCWIDFESHTLLPN